MSKGGVHPLVKALVLFHVFAVTVWSLPNPPFPILVGSLAPRTPEQHVLAINERYLKRSPIEEYIQTFGLFQAWDMFAPDPTNRNVWGDAVVIFRNGERKVQPYPRLATMAIPQKYVKERYRKFYERAHLNEYSYMWSFFGQRMAYLAAQDPSNPPVEVVLRRYVKLTPPTMTASEYLQGFGQRSGLDRWFPPNPTVDPAFPSEEYFVWIVNQEQLARDKGWR